MSVIVTIDNFIRAETDHYFAGFIKEGALGRYHHSRTPPAIDDQDVVRMNRDTLYSMAVFDLDAGDAAITLPDGDGRYMAMQVIDEDHYTHGVEHGPARRTLSKADIGTRYAITIVRTLVDPQDPADIASVHRLQDAIVVTQAKAGSAEFPDWDQESLAKVRDLVKALGTVMPDFSGAFGAKGEVDPVRRLVGTAAGWGGNPDDEAMYLAVSPEHNDGRSAYRLQVKDVPVDGFWSISLYNAEGYFEPNERNAYSVNNLTAKKDPDGAITVQFGGDPGQALNYLPTPKGWNYTVRLYRPRAELRSGAWQFPQPELLRPA